MKASEILAKLEAEFGEAHLGGNPVVMYWKVAVDYGLERGQAGPEFDYDEALRQARFCEEEVDVYEKAEPEP